MKNFVRAIVTLLLLGSLTLQADPWKTWNWDNPTSYTNGNPIPGSDVLETLLYCNDIPGEQGAPYEVMIQLDDPGAPPSVEDMDIVVQGRPGTFYCAATSYSPAFSTESEYSNEGSFTVTADSLGFVPLPPTNLTLQ